MRIAPVVLLALVACKPKDTFDRAGMLEHTAHDVIHPVNEALRTEAEALASEAATFCAAPTETGLEGLRTRWLDLKHGLKRIMAWQFGPYRFFGVEIGKNVDKWPGDDEAIEALLASETVLDAAWAASADYRLRTTGYPAVGYLLHSDDTAAATLARFTGDGGARRCGYLETLATHAQGFVVAYEDGWDPAGGDYAGEVATAGRGSDAYPSEQDAITALVSGMLSATTQLSAMNLGWGAGDTTGGTPQPDLVEAPYSHTSLEHAGWVIDGVEAVYLGDGDLGISDYVVSRQAAGDVDGLVVERIAGARAALAAVPAPYETAVVDSPTEVRAAIDAVDALSAVLNGEVSTLLGINPTAVEGDND